MASQGSGGAEKLWGFDKWKLPWVRGLRHFTLQMVRFAWMFRPASWNEGDAVPRPRVSQLPVYANILLPLTETMLIFIGDPISKLPELRWGFPPSSIIGYLCKSEGGRVVPETIA